MQPARELIQKTKRRDAMVNNFRMSETEQKIRNGCGSAAAAAAIFAPLSYKWKAILTAAAEVILAAVYGFSPLKRFFVS
jgi:hypothetical protein